MHLLGVNWLMRMYYICMCIVSKIAQDVVRDGVNVLCHVLVLIKLQS